MQKPMQSLLLDIEPINMTINITFVKIHLVNGAISKAATSDFLVIRTTIVVSPIMHIFQSFDSLVETDEM